MKAASVITLLAIVFGTALATAFSMAYDIAVSKQLALLFGLVGLVLAMLLYGLWRWTRRDRAS